MQSALKDVFGTLFEQLLQGEMEHHLGYSAHSREDKEDDNRRNGYGSKTVRTSYGEVPIDVLRDRSGTFESQVIPKRQKDVSAIENKVLAMYARACPSEI